MRLAKRHFPEEDGEEEEEVKTGEEEREREKSVLVNRLAHIRQRYFQLWPLLRVMDFKIL